MGIYINNNALTNALTRIRNIVALFAYGFASKNPATATHRLYGRYMPMKIFNRLVVILFVVVSLIQVFGVGETLFRIVNDWRKFYGYDHIGGITLGTTMVYFTYIVSFLIVALSFLIIRNSDDRITKALSKLSIWLLSTGVIVLSTLLISPFAELYSR